jgi:hypothetical protein
MRMILPVAAVAILAAYVPPLVLCIAGIAVAAYALVRISSDI